MEPMHGRLTDNVAVQIPRLTTCSIAFPKRKRISRTYVTMKLFPHDCCQLRTGSVFIPSDVQINMLHKSAKR
jgi:hypothetical protein